MIEESPISQSVESAAQMDSDKNQKDLAKTPASLLKLLREKKGISQRDFAEKLGVSRMTLARLETQPHEALSLAEIKAIARALGLKTKDLMDQIFNSGDDENSFNRCSLENPVSVTVYEEGIELGAFLQETGPCYVGRLVLAPKKTMAKEKHLPGSLIFWYVLEGRLLLTIGPKEYHFKTGECFSMGGGCSYEIHNPSQVYKMTAISVVSHVF